MTIRPHAPPRLLIWARLPVPLPPLLLGRTPRSRSPRGSHWTDWGCPRPLPAAAASRRSASFNVWFSSFARLLNPTLARPPRSLRLAAPWHPLSLRAPYRGTPGFSPLPFSVSRSPLIPRLSGRPVLSLPRYWTLRALPTLADPGRSRTCPPLWRPRFLLRSLSSTRWRSSTGRHPPTRPSCCRLRTILVLRPALRPLFLLPTALLEPLRGPPETAPFSPTPSALSTCPRLRAGRAVIMLSTSCFVLSRPS